MFVQADDTKRLICNITIPEQVMTLILGRIFNMSFEGPVLGHSTHLDSRSMMPCNFQLYLYYKLVLLSCANFR